MNKNIFLPTGVNLNTVIVMHTYISLLNYSVISRNKEACIISFYLAILAQNYNILSGGGGTSLHIGIYCLKVQSS